jgi:hypothetical protein
MIIELPYDIKREIVKFLNNIEIRRYYNVYDKINMEKYRILHRITRIPCNNGLNTFDKYICGLNYESIESRKKEMGYDDFINSEDDIVEMEINLQKDKVKIEILIFKLKKKPYFNYINDQDIYFKGDLGQKFYWSILKINYCYC